MDDAAGIGLAPGQKGGHMDIVEQIKDAVADHAAEIKEGVEQVGDFIDEKTGGQYAAQVDQAQEFVKDQLGN